jgi:hypothetical protein
VNTGRAILSSLGAGLAVVLLIACSGVSAGGRGNGSTTTPTPGVEVPPIGHEGDGVSGGSPGDGSGLTPAPDPTRQPPSGSSPRPDDPVSSDPSQPRPPPRTPTPFPVGPGQRLEIVEAPIESVQVVARLSYPPQYAVQIVAGLPSGCAQPDSHEVVRDGDTFRIKVMNRVLTGDVACTMIYGMYDVNVELGSNLTPGQQYTVIVNGEATTFTAE